jgi:hypothetical protein
MLLPYQLDVALDVVALGFGDASRADADDLRLGPLVDVENGLLDILIAAEHGRDFAHRRGLQRHGFLEMPHEQRQSEGRAALRTVQKRHRSAQSHERERPAYGLAHLQRVDRASLLPDGDFRHVRSYSAA